MPRPTPTAIALRNALDSEEWSCKARFVESVHTSITEKKITQALKDTGHKIQIVGPRVMKPQAPFDFRDFVDDYAMDMVFVLRLPQGDFLINTEGYDYPRYITRIE